MRRIGLCSALLATSILLPCARLTHAKPSSLPRYRLTWLSPLSSQAQSEAFSLNNRGEIVGVSFTGDARHATLWRNGQATALSQPGSSFARDINEQGTILGESPSDSECVWRQGSSKPTPIASPAEYDGLNGTGLLVGKVAHDENHDEWAVVRENGRLTALEKPAFYGSCAYAVTDRGLIVGYADGEWSGHRAALWVKQGTQWEREFLGRLPNRDSSTADAVNNHGQIVGHAFQHSDHVRHGELRQRAFLWERGQMRDLGALSVGAQSLARGINNKGQIVGEAEVKGSEPDWIGFTRGHAVLWSGGRVYDLNRLTPLPVGWTLSRAYAVNDRGLIVGVAEDEKQHARAFLLTPQ